MTKKKKIKPYVNDILILNLSFHVSDHITVLTLIVLMWRIG